MPAALNLKGVPLGAQGQAAIQNAMSPTQTTPSNLYVAANSPTGQSYSAVAQNLKNAVGPVNIGQGGAVSAPTQGTSSTGGGSSAPQGAFGKGGGQAGNVYTQNDLPPAVYNAGSGAGGTITWNGVLYRVLNNGDGTRTVIPLGTPPPQTPAVLPPSTPAVSSTKQFTVAPPSVTRATEQPASASLSFQSGKGPATQTTAAKASPQSGGGGIPLTQMALDALKNAQAIAAPVAQNIGGKIKDITSQVGQDLSQVKGLTGAPIHMGSGGTTNALLGNVASMATGLPIPSIPAPDIGLSETAASLMNMGRGQTPQSGSAITHTPVAQGSYVPGQPQPTPTPAPTQPGTGQPTPSYTPPANAPGYFQNAQGTPVAPTSPQATLAAGVTKPADIQKQVTNAITGKGDVNSIASNVASPAALPVINKMIDSAQKSGNVAQVQKLADFLVQVQQNIDFQQRMGQIISQITQGFGTPNAPGVSAARQPLVQQGVFGGLTTPQTPQFSLPNVQQSPLTQQLIPPIPQPESPVGNQLKPQINPYTPTA